jgi:PKD repeat protein
LEAAEAPAAPAEAYAQQVQIVGDRAFVLDSGVWTDTTFDPTRMSTVRLPFGSDAFFDLLADHPEAGRYLAVGERVIVVINGVAYETVASDEEAPQSAPSPLSDEPPPSSDLPLTSPPPDDAGEVYVALSADVVEGDAPLTVSFTGQLVGGRDNNRDYYCVESAFEFGDGMVQSAIPGCIEWTPEAEIQREYSASYVYDEPGVYQVVFSLGGSQSEPLTILVHDGAETRRDDAPIPSLAADETEDGLQQGEGKGLAGSICFGAFGLALLPLVGLAVCRNGWFCTS